MNADIQGCGTALVTPFRRDGSIDQDALRRLVQFQLREGIDFLVPCGTTGETPTLEHGEYLGVIRLVLEETAGKAPVIAGVGGNSTKKVIELAQEVERLGVQGILSVAPYYNKPTQEGLYQHFNAIAESTHLPVILYNVPGRTSSNIEPGTVARLSKVPNIVGIKEASGSITQQMEVLNEVDPGFRVLSGDDAFTLPLMALGGVGVISVASNEIPGPMTRLAHLLLDGREGPRLTEASRGTQDSGPPQRLGRGERAPRGAGRIQGHRLFERGDCEFPRLSRRRAHQPRRDAGGRQTDRRESGAAGYGGPRGRLRQRA